MHSAIHSALYMGLALTVFAAQLGLDAGVYTALQIGIYAGLAWSIQGD
ncbi:MAG: hypothetical protein AAF701_08210 [Pseudomonadota bacterium]